MAARRLLPCTDCRRQSTSIEKRDPNHRLDFGRKPHIETPYIESVEQTRSLRYGGTRRPRPRGRESPQRRQQRDVNRQSLFGRSATTWRRTILPRVTLSTGRLRLWFHTARCARVYVIQQRIDDVQPVTPNCCPLAKIADRDIADARYAATDALGRRLTESTRAEPHFNVFGLPERH
jgi:hypothetical protein